MRVIAERERCCGAGMCVLTVPEVFDQDERGLVTVREAELPSALHEAVREAVELCPSGTLHVEIEPAISLRGEARIG